MNKQVKTTLEDFITQSDALLKELKMLVMYDRDVGKNQSGKFWIASRRQVRDVQSAGKTSQAVLPVVLLTETLARKKLKRGQQKSVASAIRYLVEEKKISSPFVHTRLLYHSKNEDVKIDLAASQTLWGFFQTFYGKRQYINIDQVRDLMGQVILGLEVLHEKGIAHCDLKTENILIF